MKKPYQLTTEDIEFICHPLVTAKDVMKRYGCGYATVARWRKKFGWSGRRGSNPGPRPWQRKHFPRPCYREGCEESVINQKYCSQDCQRLCPEFLAALRGPRPNSKAGAKTKETTPAFTRYRNKVHKLSDKVYQENIDLINPERHPRTLAGVEGGYQLDHIYTIKDGFENEIPPKQLAVVENLRVIPWRDNLARNRSK